MPASIINEQIRNLLCSWPEMAMILIYKNFYHNLIRIADMHTHDRQASMDVLQEVFTDVWEKRKALDRRHDESIQNYLIKAVQYHAISLYRKRTKTAAGEAEYYYGNPGDSFEYPAETRIIAEEKQTFLRLAIATFPAREKECLLMQVDQELPVKDIARRLGIKKKAVERSLTSARNRLKKFRETLL